MQTLQKVAYETISESIDRYIPKRESMIGRQAIERINRLLHAFPPFFGRLLEPWDREPLDGYRTSVIKACANMHLYARILDDAVDICLPVHRANLLVAQPILVEACMELGALRPHYCKHVTTLINETVNAVIADDNAPDPWLWGQKNYHLLVAPLFLADDLIVFETIKPICSTLIIVDQMHDEYEQGVIDDPQITGKVLAHLLDWLKPGVIKTIKESGWVNAGECVVQRVSQLLNNIARQ